MLRKLIVVVPCVVVVTLLAALRPPAAPADVDLPLLEPQFIACEPEVSFTGLVNGQIAGVGGCLPVRANLDFRDKLDANTLHWYLEVATIGANAATVWSHRYPDFVVPVNTPALNTFIQDLMMPAGKYWVQLSIRDYVIDGATGQPVERSWVTVNTPAVVNP